MPISNKSIEKMAKTLGVDKAKIEEALSAETDIDIEIPDVKVLTTDGLRKIESEKYNEGKEAGIEIEVKKFKTENNLQFSGKSISDLAAHLQSVSDVEGRVRKLQENLTVAERKAVEAEQKLENVALENEIYNAIPAEYSGLSKRALKVLAEVDGGYTFKKEDGKLVAYKDGQSVRDERTQNNLAASDVLKTFFEVDKGFKVGNEPTATERKGRGGEGIPAKPAATNMKRSEIEKEWVTNNPDKHLGGAEYASHFAQVSKQAKESGQSVEMD